MNDFLDENEMLRLLNDENALRMVDEFRTAWKLPKISTILLDNPNYRNETNVDKQR